MKINIDMYSCLLFASGLIFFALGTKLMQLAFYFVDVPSPPCFLSRFYSLLAGVASAVCLFASVWVFIHAFFPSLGLSNLCMESGLTIVAGPRYTAGMRADGIAPCPKCGTFGDHYCPADVGVD